MHLEYGGRSKGSAGDPERASDSYAAGGADLCAADAGKPGYTSGGKLDEVVD